MARTLVFIPVQESQLGAIAGQVTLSDVEAYRVTDQLREQFGYTAKQSEEAEYAAMMLAAVASLSQHGRRTVLVAEVDPAQIQPGTDPANGHCRIARVQPSEITCWFADGADVDAQAAAAAAKGLPLDEAWDALEVQELIHGHDLLWNDAQEYGRYSGR